jgi:cobalt/nickel transport system permease protein
MMKSITSVVNERPLMSLLACLPAAVWAVHIADGILTAPWLAGGAAVAVALAAFGAWRIREEEIPQVAVLTAAFFVASLIHVRVGPTSVHLLLNGLVGVVLGRRAALAIPPALFLQAALLMHGGYSTLGVNSCVMVLPALAAGQLFALLTAVPWVRAPGFRAALVATSAVAWTLSAAYSLTLLCSNRLSTLAALDPTWANYLTFHPLTVAAALVLGGLAAMAERRLEEAPEFALGLLVGEAAVLLTMLLNCLVLLYGGEEDWHALALVTFVAHLPVAVIEGIVLGFTVGFLAKVKPEMLGLPAASHLAPAEPTATSQR